MARISSQSRLLLRAKYSSNAYHLVQNAGLNSSNPRVIKTMLVSQSVKYADGTFKSWKTKYFQMWSFEKHSPDTATRAGIRDGDVYSDKWANNPCHQEMKRRKC